MREPFVVEKNIVGKMPVCPFCTFQLKQISGKFWVCENASCKGGLND